VTVRVVLALGGNALLRRGEALSAENQRANVRLAARALAPVALEHELVISHGNGPQVGLLALQASAYKAVAPYPLDVLDAQTEGMIGYLIQQELGNELPFEKRLATLLTLIEVDGCDPAFDDPTKPIGPLYSGETASRLGAEKGWVFKRDGDDFRRVVPSPTPQRIFGLKPVEWLLQRGCVVICAGGGGIPVMYSDEPAPAGRRLIGVEAVIDKDLASALLAMELHADVLAILTDVDAVYDAWGTVNQRAIRRANPQALAGAEFPSGSMGPKVRAACWFVERTGGVAVIGSIADTQALVRQEVGTTVTRDAVGIELAVRAEPAAHLTASGR
jgi:carbamate kinase